MSAGNRSWTDAITNAALFAGFDAEDYLRWLNHRTTRVDRALPQFLHEFTHHWCFDSLVGSAIALLVLRARRHALLFGAQRIDQIRRDMCRAQTAELMLQPMAEGLALFAEFDLTPGKGSVVSQTSSACVFCFGFPVRVGNSKQVPSEIALQVLLQTTRRQPHLLERKAGVYAQRFEVEQGYLAGYLALKSLWAQLSSRATALSDRDVFFSFIRAYVYEDAGFVAALLREDGDDFEVCAAAAQRFCDRLAALVEDEGLPARIEQWELACGAGTPVFEAIDVHAQTVEPAREALLMLLADGDSGATIGDFAAHAMMTLQERAYVTLGQLPANAVSDVGGNTRIVTVGVAPISYERTLGLPQGAISGDVIAVIPSRHHCVMVFFVANGGCHLIESFGDTSQADVEPLHRYLLNRKASSAVHAELESALAALMPHPELAAMTEIVRSSLLPAAEELYGTLATLSAEDGDVQPVLARLRAGGLLALLDGDIDLVRGIAAVGLANTVGSDNASLSLFAVGTGLGTALLDRTIDTASERLGLKLLGRRRGGDGVIAMV